MERLGLFFKVSYHAAAYDPKRQALVFDKNRLGFMWRAEMRHNDHNRTGQNQVGTLPTHKLLEIEDLQSTIVSTKQPLFLGALPGIKGNET